ncbi:hypothetical protein tb265_47180 [Gemmatimonadetes bacterium T265]|nr:hypothetical protein tb265_47180 [Gemmatimonadetes bacterium T265]
MPRRLDALDQLRGLLMVLMAVDHASYFVGNRHPLEFWGVPLPAYDATPAGTGWLLTRIVTHVCAPGFFLLMGASMVLFADGRRAAGWSEARIRRYWITRGLLLLVLQQLVENPAWLLGTLDDPVGTVVPGAWLLRAPTAVLAVLAPAAVLTAAALVPPAGSAAAPLAPLRLLLVTPGRTGMWQVFYPALPWTGVAAAGLVLGRAVRRVPARPPRAAALVGVGLLAAFVGARFLPGALGVWLNVTVPPGPGWRAALAVVKYPPAPTYLLLTLGVVLVLLGGLARVPRAGGVRGAAGDGGDGRGRNGPLLVFGQTALFFYLLHLHVYALLGLALPGPHALGVTYAAWAAGLVPLYAACRGYRTFKTRRPPGSRWRLV